MTGHYARAPLASCMCHCGRCRKCIHRSYVASQRRWIGFTPDKICDALQIVRSPQSSLDPRKIQHLRLPDHYFMTREDNKRLRDSDESRRWFKCPFGGSRTGPMPCLLT